MPKLKKPIPDPLTLNTLNVSTIKAKDANGLSIQDDGGNLGVFIEDGGDVGVGTTTPTTKLHSVSTEQRAALVEGSHADGSFLQIKGTGGVGTNTFETGINFSSSSPRIPRSFIIRDISLSNNGIFVLERGTPDDTIHANAVGVGIKTADPKTALHFVGGLTGTVTTVNVSTYDLLVTDHILNVTYTATAAVTSLTLPTAQALSGRMIVIKDAGGLAGTNNITVDTEGGGNIDGAATAVINTNYQSLTIYCDGTNWFII